MDIRPKKLLAGLLALIMVLGMLPTSVFAAEADDGVVIIDNTATTVTTETDLAAALANGGTVTLGADINVATMIEIPTGVNVVLDLAGHDIIGGWNGSSTTNHIYVIANRGTLTVKDSVGEGKIVSRGVYNYGTLTLESGTIDACDGNGGYAVNNESGSTFVMNGGVVSVSCEDDHLNVNGGYDATALDVPAGCTATLNGGEITSVTDFTFAITAAGTLNVPKTSTVVVEGNHGAVYVSGGITTIDGGTFKVIKDEDTRTDNVTYVDGGKLIINGGTFVGDDDTASGGSCVCDEAGGATINGGDFSKSSGGDVWGTTGTIINGGTFENLTETSHVTVGATITNGGKTYTKTENGLEEVVELPEYVVLPEGVTVASFGDNTVTDGNGNFYATLKEALLGIHLTNNRVLYCKPGADVGVMTHGHVCDDLTVYGNGAKLTASGEQDFEVDTYKFCHNSANPCSGVTGDLTLTVKYLNGCGAWGQRNTANTVNLVFENCKDMNRVYISGTSGVNNITLKNCSFLGSVDKRCTLYSNANGTITVDTVEFANIYAPVNLNHKVAGTQTVKIENSTFTDCGTAEYDYAAPVRVLSSVDGAKTELTVSGTTFTGTKANKQDQTADILLDYGVGETTASVSTTAANVTVEKKDNVGTTTTVTKEETNGFTNVDLPVAQIGDVKYTSIDDAIAAWTNNTTLTLLADVTLSDVVTLKSTEHHILDLGTYTLTAAEGKNAFVIQACGNGSAERSAITINADATNPGGINAGSKCVVYYKYADGGISTEDRPIIKINGGVFTGATSSFGTAGIYTIGTAARKCATVHITGGTFNCSINGSGKSKLIISGGTFNYSVGSQGDSTALRLISGGTFKTLGFMTADSNNTKFWFGTSMGNSNVGVHVDDNGYIVVGGPVVTEAGSNFEASSANYSGASYLLQYSSAEENGLYYTSVEEAFADNNKTTGEVTVYVDELDMTGISYQGAIIVPAESSLTITNAPETLVVKDAEGNVLEPSANGTYTTIEPQGNDFTGYTRGDAIWGEAWGNASESFVIKVLDANGNVMGTTSLNNIGGIIDGDVNVTWSILLDAASNTDTYWTMQWTTAPSLTTQPATVELWVDGVKVSGGNVVLNAPDDLNKIVAAVANADGVITGFYTKLSDAITAASKTRTTGNVVCVLRDVTESVEAIENVTLTTNVAGGVTINNTATGWIGVSNLTVGKGVTLKAASFLVEGGLNTIEGELSVTTLYNAYDSKTIVQNGGKIVTTGMIVNRYHNNADSGIYVYGDGDDTTVEVSCADTIGTYSGTFYAKDAVVEGNMLWIDYLKNSTQEDDKYSQSKPVFENSKVSITKELRLYKDATLTLTNSNITAGTVQIRENATPVVTMDTASSVKANEVLNLAGASMDAILGADGTITFQQKLLGEGTEADPIQIKNLAQLKMFRDKVNAGETYAGKYVKLTADINLAGEEWTPIGYMGKTFKGTFDGGYHTISNLKITKTLTNTAANNGIGLFGRTDGNAVIKDLTIENVDITGSLYVGAVVGYGYTGKSVENVTVKGNITIDAWWYAGVIGGNGYMSLVNNCHVIGNNGSYVKGNDGSYIGGIWGFRGEGNNQITNCSVTNVDIIGVDRVGGICGIGHYGNTISGCEAENVTVTATDPDATTVGLIVGACQGNASEPTVFNGNTLTNTTAQIANGDGTYTAVTGLYGTNIDGTTAVTNYVAKVGDVYYKDLQEAIVAAAPSGTVTLLTDVTVDKWVMITQSLTISTDQLITLDKIDGLTIDGNGKSLTIKSIESAGNGARLFYDADELNIKNLTINYVDAAANVGGICLTSGTIENVTINGGVGVYPGTGKVTITGCTFKTAGAAIYNEQDRDNLVVTGNTFETAAGQYAIYLRGNTTFTDNTVISGKVNVTNSATGTISGNDFGDERFKVYNGAKATISNNTINNLEFSDTTVPGSTFTGNTLSAKAQAALDAVMPKGEGTQADPIQIENLDQLKWFRDQVNAGNNFSGKYVKLTADIDLAGEAWTPIGNVNYNTKYVPADTTKVFSGVFDGNGKAIKNLTISSTVGGADTQANVGLFGITGEGAVIKNLTITNVNINTDGRNVGALAGFAYKATLDNITVNGNIQIKGGNNVSGVCGMTRYYAMSATNISVEGDAGSAIVGNNIVGGIFAEIAPNGSAQTFQNLSVENVAITGAGGVGGIVGLQTEGVVDTVSVKNVVLTGRTDYQGNAMGRIRLGSVAGLLGSKYATIKKATVENVTAKNLDGNAVVLPIIGANYDASSNATEAKIGDTYYATLTEAIKAAQAGDTITLLADVAEDVVVAADKNIVLDLNGNDIVGTMNAITNNGTLVINDTVGTGNVYTTDVAAQGRATIVNNGTLTINAGWFGDSNNDTTDRNAINRGNALKNYGTATINGGYFTNVSNQYISAEAYAYAINTMTGGTTTINNATVYGDINGLIYSAGETVVEDGSFTLGRPNEENNLWYLAYGNVEIKGGTWNRAFKVPSWNTGDPTFFGEVEISGGTFTNDVSKFAAEGYVVEDNGNGTYGVKAWDGVTIANLEQLKWFRDKVNAGETYAGKTVTLTADIDLAGEAWTPIGTKANPFKGNFNGGDHTIKNLVVTGENNVGFFGYANACTIKNLKIENATVTGADCVGGIAGQVYSVSTIDNCHVSGSIKIEGQTNVGGIVGKYYVRVSNSSVIGDGIATSYVKGTYVKADYEGDNIGGIMGHGGENNNFVGNTVKDITISGTRKVGGIVGTTSIGTDVSGSTVENVKIETTATAEYSESKATSMGLGGLIGHYTAGSDGIITNNTVKGVTFVIPNGVTAEAGIVVGNDRSNPGKQPESVTVSGLTAENITGTTHYYFMVAKVGDVYYEDLQKAIKAAKAGDTVTLLADVTVTEKFDLNGVNLDLNGNTMYLKITGNYVVDTVTISNGTIDVSGNAVNGNTFFTVGGQWAKAGSVLNLDEVKLIGDGYRTDWAVICVHNGTSLNMTDCTVDLKNDNGSAGGFIKDTSGNSNTATVTITDTTLNLENIDRGFTGAKVTLDKVNLTITGGEHGINGAELTVKDSTVSISDGTGRGITLNKYDAAIINSTVTLTNMGEGGIRFKTGNELSIDASSTFAQTTAHADLAGATVNGQAVTGTEDDMSTVAVADGITTVVNPVYVAEVNGVQYKTLAEAIAAAQAGDTVTLLADVALTEGVVIAADDVITLELNGKTISRNTEAAVATAAITNNGNLTIQDSAGGGKITAFAANPDTAEIPYYANNTITNSGVLTIKSGTIENSTSDAARAAYPIDNNSTVRDAILNIEGGTITGRGAIRQFANSTTHKNEVNITGGTVTGTSYGIWMQNPGSKDPIASLNVSDGEIAKILLSPSANFAPEITGGKVSEVAIWEADTTNTSRNPSGFITGGTFDTDVSDFCAEGYIVVPNANGTYGIEAGLRGSGIESDPYMINTVTDLKLFRDSVNAGETKYNAEGVYVALGADIDMSGIDWSVNIGDAADTSFDGIFDGKNHKILNLTSTETAKDPYGYTCTGLFGCIAGNAQVKNLTLENVNIDAAFAGNNVGALVGFVWSGAPVIENVTVTGNISINAPETYGVGAIVGYAYESKLTVKNSKVAASDGSAIIAISGVGGIIGYSGGSVTVSGCSVENISLRGLGLAGGIIGISSGVNNATDSTVKNVAIIVTGEYWKNSAAVVIGTMATNGTVVSGATFENVTANGEAISNLVGSAYVEKPTAEVPAVQARIGDKYYASLTAAIAAANGGEVEILCDVTASLSEIKNVTLTTNVAGGVTVTNTDTENWISMTNVTIGSGVTLDMDNAYYTGAGVNVIEGTLSVGTLYNANDSKTTVQNGGKIVTTGMIVNRYHNNADSGIYVYGDGDDTTVEVSCANTIGTYSGTFYAKDAVVEGNMLWIDYLKNGTTEADTYSQSKPVFENSVVNITNELRFYKDATLTLTDSTVTAGTVQVRENATPVVSMDSTSVIKASAVLNLEGASLDAVLGEDGTVTFQKPVAKIGNTKYYSLADAIAAAQAGDTVTLLADVEQDAMLTIDKAITLDLNGHTITGTDNSTGNFGLINLAPGAEFILDDTVGTGKITLTATNNRGWGGYSSVISVQRAKLTVNAGTLEHLGGSDMAYAIDILTNTGADNAEAVINGGTIKSTYRAIRQFANSTKAKTILTVNGGTIEGANKSIWMQNANALNNPAELSVNASAAIKGDVLVSGSNASEWTLELSVNDAALQGESTVVGSKLPETMVVENANGVWGIADAVASVNGVGYATLAEALAAAQDGDTITILRDVAMTAPVVNTKKVTIDLNGKTVSYTTTESKGESMITNRGDLTIQDSVGTGKLSYAYTGAADSSYGYGNQTIENFGTLTLVSGTVENTSAAMSHASYAINNREGATLNIKGGKVLNLNAHAIRQTSFGTAANTVNISGGYVEGTRAIQFQLPGSAGAAAAEMTLNISGGVLKSNEATYNLALYVYSNGQSAEKVKINITGGTFNGNVAINAAATGTMADKAVSVTNGVFNGDYGVFSYADDEVAKPVISLTGGTYETNYSEIYAQDDGYVFKQNADGTYGLTKAPAAFHDANKNGTLDADETVFQTVAQALAAAKSGDVVVMNADSDETGTTLVIMKGVTLDLNGHNLTADGLVAFKGNYLIDSATTKGALKVSQGNLSLQIDNAQVPVYTTEGYVLIAVKRQQKMSAQTTDGFTFLFRPSFGTEYNKLFATGGTDKGISIIARVSWIGGSGPVSQDFVYSEEFVKAFGTDSSFTLTMKGVGNAETFKDLTVTTVIVSDTGVEWVAETTTYTGNQ